MPSDHRLHPASIVFALAGSLKAFLLPAGVLILTSGRSSPQASDPGGWGPARWMNRWMPGDMEIANWQFWLLVFLIPTTIAALVRYFTFRLRYEGTELVISSGILFRNERHVPYARIQNLDAVRNVAHRLLGVAEVRIETGGGKAPEATISVLHETVFEEMRRRIFAARDQVIVEKPRTSSEAQPEPESKTLLYLPLRELLLNGLLENRGMVLVAAAYGVLWEAGLFRTLWEQLTNGAYAPGFLRDTIVSVTTGDLPSVGRIGIAVVSVVGLLLLVRLLSMVWSFLRLHEFRLTRVGQDLRTEYGLLTRVTTTVPLKRVQSLTVRESPLQRLVKRMSVRVETAGGHSSDHDNQSKHAREWLAPIIRRSAVPALVSEVLPGFDLDRVAWQPLHPRAFRRAIKPALLLASITVLPFVFWFGWIGLFVVAITVPLLVTLAWSHVYRTHWALRQGSGQAAGEDALVFRSGWMWRQITIVPATKIQVVGRIESPFDRRAAMAGVRVDTAGSMSPAHRISIPYLARDTAAALYERLASQTAQTAFRW
jgi:putative membrane protein